MTFITGKYESESAVPARGLYDVFILLVLLPCPGPFCLVDLKVLGLLQCLGDGWTCMFVCTCKE